MEWIVASCIVLFWGVGAFASEPPRTIIHDNQGAQVGRIEPNPVLRDQYVVKDAQGRRVGTVEPNTVLPGEWVVKDAQGRRTVSVRR